MLIYWRVTHRTTIHHNSYTFLLFTAVMDPFQDQFGKVVPTIPHRCVLAGPKAHLQLEAVIGNHRKSSGWWYTYPSEK